ncbi:hypothetical protein ACIP5Y_21285 [Nocardia sp. NPDC088792]|uniref:hypothetical protein n=1 Tax=Nocardia sp. NPDC088792 TaxID=3364332 RepID=UPI0038067A30
MTRAHRPKIEVAERFTEAFAHALHLHTPAEHTPTREVPAATDWDDWHWDRRGGDQ